MPAILNQTSRSEIRILSELKFLLEDIKVQWRSKSFGREIDVYIPDFKLGIEFDSFYYHSGEKNKIKDQNKTKFFEGKSILLIRVREKPLQKVSKHDLLIENNPSKKNLNDLFITINTLTKGKIRKKVKNYYKLKDFGGKQEFKRILSYLPRPTFENSFAATHPEIVKQWHPTKNGELKASYFTSGSKVMIWWKCSKGKDHEWQATINNRTSKQSNSLAILYPKLIAEWHPTRNGTLNPKSFSYGSNKKIWWQCLKCNHEWIAVIKRRAGKDKTGCPVCARRITKVY